MDNVVNAKRSRAKASDAAAEGKPSRDEAEAAVDGRPAGSASSQQATGTAGPG